MEKIRIGVICPSEIAHRRFMPALDKLPDLFEFRGIAVANEAEWTGKLSDDIKEKELQKAGAFIEEYGGTIYNSYASLIADDRIDAVYLPLPPALHYQWAKSALEHGKHVFVEKPSTTCVKDTKQLIETARANQLALHENYMFVYHSQIEKIKGIMSDKGLGDIRLIRADFGFPKRPENDFRYNKELGGGALLDCGGYTLKLTNLLMGMGAHIDAARLFYNYQNIDLYGSVQLSNHTNVAQVSFGMDNEYRCSLEIWGSSGTLRTGRIFSAPDNLQCTIEVEHNHETEKIEIAPDDTFKKSLMHFSRCVLDNDIREKTYGQILEQSALVENAFRLANQEEK